MGLMIGISALTIGALAASTMAWYSVSASITVNSSTVSIRTALQYHFYAYKGNRGDTTSWTAATNTAYAKGSGYASESFDIDPTDANVENSYQEINALAYYDDAHHGDYIEALTNASGLWPGYKMSFAVQAVGLDSTLDASLSLSLNTNYMRANTSTATNVWCGASDAGDTTANYHGATMLDAIKICAGSGRTLADAYTNSNGSTANTYYRNYDNNGLVSEWADANNISFGTAQISSNGVSWWFFTLEFSDDNWAHYAPNATISDNSNTYYKQANNGNSNCFQGLTFNLGTLDLK